MKRASNKLHQILSYKAKYISRCDAKPTLQYPSQHPGGFQVLAHIQKRNQAASHRIDTEATHFV